jgi:hypothetical protein
MVGLTRPATHFSMPGGAPSAQNSVKRQPVVDLVGSRGSCNGN